MIAEKLSINFYQISNLIKAKTIVMKKITLIITILSCNLMFSAATPNPVVVIIPDVTIEGPEFHLDIDYQVPTKLIFPNLVSVRGSLDIRRNSNLVMVEAPLLEDVGDNLVIDENVDLIEISFPKLRHVDANIVVVENLLIEHIKFPLLERTGGDLHIYASPNLLTVEMPNLQKICGGFSFHLNHSITSIHLPSLLSVGHFCGPHIGSFFNIFNNNKLVVVDAPNLGKVDFVNVNNNPELKKLNLCSLIVDEDLTVMHNHANLNPGPPFCYEDEIEEDIAIIEITDQNLDNIYYHKENFQEPTKLVFTNLTSVDGYIYFHQNNNLVEVDFPLLETTGEYFYYHQNANMEVINAPNLNSVGNYLYVDGHPILEQLNICSLEQIVQLNQNIQPYYHISNNNELIDIEPFCFEENLDEEQEVDAGNTLAKTLENEEMKIYPNPSKDLIYVNSKKSLSEIIIYDFSGNLVKAFNPKESKLDISDISSGIYLLVSKDKKGTATTRKLIIQ